MERLLLAPGPPLSRFVELLWYYRNDAQPHAKERLMPDGCISIVINLAEDQTRLYDNVRPRWLHSFRPSHQILRYRHDEQNHVVGISFRPAGAIPFLKLPSADLCDQHLALADLWGPSARKTISLSNAVKTFLHSPQTAIISKVVTETGFGSRRFIELFKHHVGLPPKLFCRVRRFQSVLRQITTGRPVRWTDIALDCGYFDQAHFIHDGRFRLQFRHPRRRKLPLPSQTDGLRRAPMRHRRARRQSVVHRHATPFLRFAQSAFNAKILQKHEDNSGLIAHDKFQTGDTVLELSESHGQWGPRTVALHYYLNPAHSQP